MTEARVYDNIFAALPNSCIVSSIHRLHLMDRFDEVIVMHEGRVVAQGPASRARGDFAGFPAVAGDVSTA